MSNILGRGRTPIDHYTQEMIPTSRQLKKAKNEFVPFDEVFKDVEFASPLKNTCK